MLQLTPPAGVQNSTGGMSQHTAQRIGLSEKRNIAGRHPTLPFGRVIVIAPRSQGNRKNILFTVSYTQHGGFTMY